MDTKITLKKLDFLCESLMDWDIKDVETRFHGTRKELVEALNACDELAAELFFSGFFCDNPIVELAADGQTNINKLSSYEKVQVFIRRGLVLCYLTNHEPGFVVKPHWKDKHSS